MSDEKLSAEIERRLQELDAIGLALKSTNAPRGQQVKDCVARLRTSLARLERERDAARSETLEEAAALCKRRAIWLRTEILDTFRTEATNYTAEFLLATADRILELAPSIVSQPSREREVLEAALLPVANLATDDELQHIEEDHFGLAQFVFSVANIRKAKVALAALTATPASTGGGK